MDFPDNIVNQITHLFSGIGFQILMLISIATLHGYGAAWLAVRMLFRPRRPFRVLGITLFPQGMIPRHRERLAIAIGKAVGEELVSQETILEELVGKEFLRRKIRDVVDSYSSELISQSYPSLIEAIPASVRAPVLDSISSLQLKVAEHIDQVLKSEETLGTINGFVTRRVDEVLSRRVAEVLDDAAFDKIVVFLEERIRAALGSDAFELKIREFIDERVDDLMNTSTPLGDMFTPDAVSVLKEKALDQIAPVAHHLTEIAATERTRDQIGSLIKREVHDYYENLPFFKKIFVSRENLLGEVDDLVNESLPQRIEETLKGDVFAKEAGDFIDTSIDNALARPLPEIIGSVNPEQLQRLKDQISGSVLTLLRGEAMMSQVSAYLSDALEQFRPHSIDSILRTLHPESEEKLKQMLSRGLMSIIARPDTSRIINELLARQIDSLLSAPIGRLSDHISEDKLRSAGDSLTETIISAIQEKLPEAIREFDVGGVVREKIKNYPAEKLEELVLSVAKEHLRTIEFFGALFGFFIGIAQAVQFYFYSNR
jgi:uncharacterized membrane protein YheB (UPF0754 family)